jgi:hypothetical protein
MTLAANTGTLMDNAVGLILNSQSSELDRKIRRRAEKDVAVGISGSGAAVFAHTGVYFDHYKDLAAAVWSEMLRVLSGVDLEPYPELAADLKQKFDSYLSAAADCARSYMAALRQNGRAMPRETFDGAYEEVRTKYHIEIDLHCQSVIAERRRREEKRMANGQRSFLNSDKIAAYSGISIVLCLVAFLLIRNAPFADPNLVIVLRVVLAVAAGVVGATLPGQFSLSWKGQGLALRATGALGFSIAMLLFSPKVVETAARPPEETRPQRPAELTSRQTDIWNLFEQWMKDQSPLIKQHGYPGSIAFANVHEQYFQTGLMVYNVSSRWAFLFDLVKGTYRKVAAPSVQLTPGDARHINEVLFSKLTQGMSEENSNRYRKLIESRTQSLNAEAIGITGGIATLYVENELYDFWGGPVENETHAFEVLTGKGRDYEVIIGLRHDAGSIDTRWVDPRSPRRAFVMFQDDGRFEKQTVFSSR